MSLLTEFFAPRTDDRKFPSIAAMERASKRNIPKFGYDYMTGGIGREDGLRRNVFDFDSVRFVPRYLTEWEAPSLETEILGQKHAAPFGPGPVGLTGLMWPNAPMHVAKGARAHDLPTCLSTYATSSIEEVGAVAGKNMWFQLYPLADEDIEADLFKRFTSVGGEVLLVTVDIPGPTRRERDMANGLAVPPQRDWRTWLAGAMRPRWAIETLRAGFPVFKNVERYAPAGGGGGDMTALAFLTSISAGHVSPERLKRYREQWSGKLVVKGVMSLEDARICAECGADGIVVSNHGGRQLDGSRSAFDQLAEVVDAVGDKLDVLVDVGVQRGTHVLKALSLGAKAVGLGRYYLFPLAAAGRPGVERALDLLRTEIERDMRLMGCSSVSQLDRDNIRFR